VDTWSGTGSKDDRDDLVAAVAAGALPDTDDTAFGIVCAHPSCGDGLYDPVGGDGNIDPDACITYEDYATTLKSLPNFCPPSMDNCHVEHSTDVDATCGSGHRVKWWSGLYLNNPHHISNKATKQVGNPDKGFIAGEVDPGPHVLPGGIKSIDTTMSLGPGQVEQYFYPCTERPPCREGGGNVGSGLLTYDRTDATIGRQCKNAGIECPEKYMAEDHGRHGDQGENNGNYYQCEQTLSTCIQGTLCGHPALYI